MWDGLRAGWRSESVDGQPVAPPMGRRQGTEGQTLRVRTLPNFWNHASGDHAVSTRP
jgi:Rieske 2Fe-2S family protein